MQILLNINFDLSEIKMSNKIDLQLFAQLVYVYANLIVGDKVYDKNWISTSKISKRWSRSLP